MAQLEGMVASNGTPEMGEVLERAKAALREARKGFQQRAEAMGSVVEALDDAAGTVDPGENEERAYEHELEAAIVIRNEFDAAASLLEEASSSTGSNRM